MGRFKNPKESLFFPEEIIEEILSRLSVKSLLRFKCVSKQWRSLIGSKRFIKIHQKNSTKITVISRGYDGMKQCSLQLKRATDPSPFDYPIINQLKHPSILGCCNGLVCIVDVDGLFLLWNPSTRIFKKLPQLHHGINSNRNLLNYGMGWDELSDDYKVFVLLSVPSSKEVIGKVYSLKTNSWKIIEHMRFFGEFRKVKELMFLPLIFQEGIFVGGKLHWDRHEVKVDIACFDLRTEVCGKIELPYNVETCYLDHMVEVIGGCLSWVNYSTESSGLEVWVMKEYGVKESWSKLAVLSHVQELVQRPFVAPFAVGRDGEVWLYCGSCFLVYYPRNNKFRKIIKYALEKDVLVERLVVESLVSPQDE